MGKAVPANDDDEEVTHNAASEALNRYDKSLLHLFVRIASHACEPARTPAAVRVYLARLKSSAS